MLWHHFRLKHDNATTWQSIYAAAGHSDSFQSLIENIQLKATSFISRGFGATSVCVCVCVCVWTPIVQLTRTASQFCGVFSWTREYRLFLLNGLRKSTTDTGSVCFVVVGKKTRTERWCRIDSMPLLEISARTDSTFSSWTERRNQQLQRRKVFV